MTAQASTRIRFVPKKVGEGKSALWRVYDHQRGSFPYQIPELGVVAQDHAKEPDAQSECDRLSAQFGGVDEKKKNASPSKAPAPDDDDDDRDD